MKRRVQTSRSDSTISCACKLVTSSPVAARKASSWSITRTFLVVRSSETAASISLFTSTNLALLNTLSLRGPGTGAKPVNSPVSPSTNTKRLDLAWASKSRPCHTRQKPTHHQPKPRRCKLTNLPHPSLQNVPSLTKLTNTTPTSSLSSDPRKYEYRHRRVSQFELAPRTLLRRMRDVSGGRVRYDSRSGGIRDDMFVYNIAVSIQIGQRQLGRVVFSRCEFKVWYGLVQFIPCEKRHGGGGDGETVLALHCAKARGVRFIFSGESFEICIDQKPPHSIRVVRDL